MRHPPHSRPLFKSPLGAVAASKRNQLGGQDRMNLLIRSMSFVVIYFYDSFAKTVTLISLEMVKKLFPETVSDVVI